MGNESSKIKTLQIVKINPGSVSHKKSLLPFMHTIVSYNGNKIRENADIAKLAFEWEEGELHLDLLDLRTEKGFSVVIPKKESTPLGMSVKYHEGALRLFSVFVSKISPGCPAQQCGLIEKDYIIGVEGVSCDSENMLLQYIELKGKEGMFLLVFNDKLNYIRRVEFKVTSEQAFEGAEVIVGILYSVKHDKKQVGMEHDSDKIKRDVEMINEKKSKVVSKMMNEEAVKEDEIKLEDLQTLEKDLDEKEVVPRDVDVIAENLSDYKEEIESKPPVEEEKSSLEKELEDIKNKINEEEIKENNKEKLDAEEMDSDHSEDEQGRVEGEDQLDNKGESVEEQGEVDEDLQEQGEMKEDFKEKGVDLQEQQGEMREDLSKSSDDTKVQRGEKKEDFVDQSELREDLKENEVSEIIEDFNDHSVSKEDLNEHVSKEDLNEQESKEDQSVSKEDLSESKEDQSVSKEQPESFELDKNNAEDEGSILKTSTLSKESDLLTNEETIKRDNDLNVDKESSLSLISSTEDNDFSGDNVEKESKTSKNDITDLSGIYSEIDRDELGDTKNLHSESNDFVGVERITLTKEDNDNKSNEDYDLDQLKDKKSTEDYDNPFDEENTSIFRKDSSLSDDHDNLSPETNNSSTINEDNSIMSKEKSQRTKEDNDSKLFEDYDNSTFGEDIRNESEIETGATLTNKFNNNSSVLNEDYDTNQFKESKSTYNEDYDYDSEDFIDEDKSIGDSDYGSSLFYDSTFDKDEQSNTNEETVTPGIRISNINETLSRLSKDEHESESILSTDTFEHKISTIVNESEPDKNLQDNLDKEHASPEIQSDDFGNLSDIYEELDERSHTDSNFSDIFSSQEEDIKHTIEGKNKSDLESVDEHEEIHSSISSIGSHHSSVSKESTMTEKSPLSKKGDKQTVKIDDHESKIISTKENRDESNSSVYETQKESSSEEKPKTFTQMIKELSIDIENKKIKGLDQPKVQEKRNLNSFQEYNEIERSTPNHEIPVKNPPYENKTKEDNSSSESKEMFLNHKSDSLKNKESITHVRKEDDKSNEQQSTINNNDLSFESHFSTVSDNFSTEVHNTFIYESDSSGAHDLSTSEIHSGEEERSTEVQRLDEVERSTEDHKQDEVERSTEDHKPTVVNTFVESHKPTVYNTFVEYHKQDKNTFVESHKQDENTLTESNPTTLMHSNSPLKDVFIKNFDIKNFDDESISDFPSFLDSNKDSSEPSWESTSFTSLKPVEYNWYVPRTDILENDKIVSPTKSGVEKVESVIVIEHNSESED